MGKEVNVTIFDKVHKIRLIDVNHVNAEGEEPEAHCTFEFKNLITKSDGKLLTTAWNDKEPRENYNFPESYLNNLLNVGEECILKKLPIGLQKSIKEVSKRVGVGENHIATPYSTKLFPLAHDEITIESESEAPSNEGTTYQYYKDHSDQIYRIKIMVDSTYTENNKYWLRSPNFGYIEESWSIKYDGDTQWDTFVTNQCAIAPAFCV